MKIKDVNQNGIVVLALSGKIMGGKETTLFYGMIQENLSLNRKNFVIDMKAVEWSNSLGLGMLIAGLASVTKAGGRIVLANVTNIQDLLAMTRLILVFETYDSLEEAIASFTVASEQS